MKVLMFSWNALTEHFIINTMRNQGVQLSLFNQEIEYARKLETRPEFMEKLSTELTKEKYDAVFSVNFVSAVAQVCHDMGVLYICWTYDSPSVGEHRQTHYYDTNRIFVFDSAELRDQIDLGVKNIWHMNLAVDCNYMNSIRNVDIKERLRYISDISFVGRLYSTDTDKLMPLLSEYAKGYINAIINTQINLYNTDIVSDVITGDLIGYLSTPEFEQAMIPFEEKLHSYSKKIQPDVMRCFIMQTVANKERRTMLAMLSKYYKVSLFSTDNPTDLLKNVSIRGLVDYMTQMPLVFKNSSINLNITARQIRKGIPQRCLDIMACRGLLLTNYQEDMLEYLEDGKDLLIYTDIGDAIEKSGYYLKNKDKADIIRNNGYEKMKKCFNYDTQLRKIWKTSGLSLYS